MTNFIILIVSIAAGVLLSRLLAKRGTGKWTRRIGGVATGLVALVVLVGVFAPRPESASKAAVATSAAPATAPVSSGIPKVLDDGGPSGLPPAPATPKAEAAPVLRTTARELFESYEANEVATDNQLKGNLVQVIGRVQSIDKDFTNSVVLRLATGNEFMSADMTLLDSQADKAAELSRGDTVLVQCPRVQRVMGSPMGRKCVLLKVKS